MTKVLASEFDLSVINGCHPMVVRYVYTVVTQRKCLYYRHYAAAVSPLIEVTRCGDSIGLLFMLNYCLFRKGYLRYVGA